MGSLFPFNTNWAALWKAQSDVKDINNNLKAVVEYDAGSPGALDVDRIVVSANMKVGAYTIAVGAPLGGGARNVTVTHTAVGLVDTLGTITVTGTDLNNAALTEMITPLDGVTVQGTKAFKTVTDVTGADWVIAEGNDTITVGFGDLIGLPDKLACNSVLYAIFNGVRETTAPTVTFSATVLALNTADLVAVLDGSTVAIAYVV